MTPILQMESMKQGEIINISSRVAHTCSYMYWSTPKFVSYTGRYKFSSFVKVTLQQAYMFFLSCSTTNGHFPTNLVNVVISSGKYEVKSHTN